MSSILKGDWKPNTATTMEQCILWLMCCGYLQWDVLKYLRNLENRKTSWNYNFFSLETIRPQNPVLFEVVLITFNSLSHMQSYNSNFSFSYHSLIFHVLLIVFSFYSFFSFSVYVLRLPAREFLSIMFSLVPCQLEKTVNLK